MTEHEQAFIDRVLQTTAKRSPELAVAVQNCSDHVLLVAHYLNDECRYETSKVYLEQINQIDAHEFQQRAFSTWENLTSSVRMIDGKKQAFEHDLEKSEAFPELFDDPDTV